AEAPAPQVGLLSDGASVSTAALVPAISRPAPEATVVLTERIDSLERAIADGRVQMLEAVERTQRSRRTWRFAVGVLTLGLLGAGALLWQMERRTGQATVRAVDAEHEVEATRQAADRRIAQTLEEAARQLAQARASAKQVQAISEVLAAPDLVRYNLTGGEAANRIAAQVLLSRSRGLVLSSSRLPPPPSDTTYQIWLLSSNEPF